MQKTKTYTKTVALEDLFNYPDGCFQRDVLSPKDNVLLLPRGIPIRNFEKSPDRIRNLLENVGIREVVLEFTVTISEDEVCTLLEAIDPSVRPIDREVSEHAVGSIARAFDKFAANPSFSVPMEEVSSVSKLLAKEIQGTSQVLLSLNEVANVDEYTYIHSLNVSLLAGYLAKRLAARDGLSFDLTETAVQSGLLHDLGKARIPREILNKPGKLSSDEYEIVKRHAFDSFQLARVSGVEDQLVLTAIKHHHERWDGRGYPDGLRGEQIPLLARLLAVADVFDALTTKRAYREAVGAREALATIMAHNETVFDPRISSILLGGVGLYPPGSVVELSNGTVGSVASSSEGNILQPKILVEKDGGFQVIDLAGTSVRILRCLDTPGSPR